MAHGERYRMAERRFGEHGVPQARGRLVAKFKRENHSVYSQRVREKVSDSIVDCDLRLNGELT